MNTQNTQKNRPQTINSAERNRRRRGPVEVRRRQGRWRIVIEGTQALARNTAGTPVDGAGHSSRLAAERQARAINRNLYKKGIIV